MLQIAVCFAAILLLSPPLPGQTGSVRGRVLDESGAVVPDAAVALNGPSGPARQAQAAGDGTYAFLGLAPGGYTIRASAPGLALRQ